MGEMVARFVLGGIIVTVFSVVGEIVKPKGFAGIFAGAPSVALATLGLAFALHGGDYAALEGRSMILGAIALLGYSLIVAYVILRLRANPTAVTTLSWVAWFVVALGLWRVLLT